MRLLLVCSLVFLSVSFGRILNYEELNSAPKSLAKDYYIYRYANERNPQKHELYNLRTQIFRYAGTIKTKFDKILGVFYTQKGPVCKKPIKTQTLSCQKSMLSVSYLAKLSKAERLDLANFFKNKDFEIYDFIKSYDSNDPISQVIANANSFGYRKYYYNANNKAFFFNSHELNERLVKKLSQERWFKDLVAKSVIGSENYNLRMRLTKLQADNYGFEISFLLGLNSLLFLDENMSLRHFSQAAKSATFSSQRDNANFWVYLISKDSKVLPSIANSVDINIYSLYAKELLGNHNIKVIVPNPSKLSVAGYNGQDPFQWTFVKNQATKLKGTQLIDFARQFYSKNTMGEYSFLMEKAYNHKISYFPMPFMDKIGTNDKRRKALILALARQESRFVPSAISTSYALGMMQFMPFLANDIGKKQLKIPNFDQDDMFKPEIAYKFANIHLDYLEKYLQSPIFIAYAYNGGIGFTKRMITGGKLFTKKGIHAKYEPFLSMELVPYAESRQYAKSVLANYVVYLSILHSNTKISQFFESLTKPGVAEKFR